MNTQLKPTVSRLFRQWSQKRSSSSSKSLQAYPGIIMNKDVHPPHKQTQGDEIRAIFRGINVDVLSYGPKDAIEVTNVAKHYFNTEGKNVRSNMTLLMAKAVSTHLGLQLDFNLFKDQMKVAQAAEMYHTASLMHDDVLDHADLRRGQPSVNSLWGELSSVYGGDFTMGLATSEVAKLKNDEVFHSMSKILESLVIGELQQMSATRPLTDSSAHRFQRYLTKTFNKTASLMAYSCQSVAILTECKAGPDRTLSKMAFNYGKDLGVAFQLVDDWLDFVADAELLGKPSAADLKLGLATAPVLFASEEYPLEMEPLIHRKFARPNDAERALKIVMKSEGLDKTKALAEQFCQSAIHEIRPLKSSLAKQNLEDLAELVLDRIK
ncbi:hypothetical protein TCAL_04434 [Tigriopus californicus]|uniref:Uncharacterized protein n=1 Tax=Tigriopus californicus TaxID=6832 RepID=A0A553NSE9_TIGCA|nr:all trans-polyprenyl-diphosphate synthase PDSS1-like [Tigriopus californicus]TRY68365.1 hypothetical protein TCAL_04434 [Tigriopus californicus]|eukprot:TCALIF_04434-PA protein Name:"Similar to Pdss1 Decaprenyl-diphosphate synthase subunit 1 (Mus musculus)" AED:0.04 eAED:0.04 QI:235/1/1/1/0.75/0.8/5/241/379